MVRSTSTGPRHTIDVIPATGSAESILDRFEGGVAIRAERSVTAPGLTQDEKVCPESCEIDSIGGGEGT